jgi:hypothetical protein
MVAVVRSSRSHLPGGKIQASNSSSTVQTAEGSGSSSNRQVPESQQLRSRLQQVLLQV